ncbi:hypothetical protein ACHAXM_006711 [Skeletonema potamos]
MALPKKKKTNNNNNKHSPLEDEPWKKDESYWDQLQQASKDPKLFEKFIEETMAKKKLVSTTTTTTTTTTSSSLASAFTSAKQQQQQQQETTTTKKKKGTYIPIEQWDAQHYSSENNNMSKEERLQWECQRNGNQFRQNEILLRNLKSF